MVLITSIILLTAAFFRKIELKSDSYTTSPVILVVILLLLALWVLNLVQIGFIINEGIHKNWKNMGLRFLILVLSIIVQIAAMIIDAPTFIYMT